MATALLSTAYLPPISYFAAMAKSGNALIEVCENFQKQSYRTRARIASASGMEFLSVPVLKGEGHKRPVSEIEIDYKRDWVLLHRRALASYYGSAPFFLYYKDDIFSVLESRPRLLVDLNTRLTVLLLELLGIRCSVGVTCRYFPPDDPRVSGPDVHDFRYMIHPKKTTPPGMLCGGEYYQVFSEKYGFLPDLSAMDLLFNEGPNSISFLK